MQPRRYRSHRSRPRKMRFIYLTDHTHSNGFDALAQLPAGSMAILRDYDHPHRATHLQLLASTAHKHGIPFLVAASPGLALRTHAAGLHAPEALIPKLPGWRRQNRRWHLTCAAHSPQALIKARRAGADAALFSPLFPTASHPGQSGKGLSFSRRLAQRAALPLIPLGGISLRHLPSLSISGFSSFAGIGIYKEMVKKTPVLLHCSNIRGQKGTFTSP